MIVLYLIGILLGLALLLFGYTYKGRTISYFFVLMGAILLFVVGLMISIHGFPYVGKEVKVGIVDETAFLFAHIGNTINITSGGVWYNVTFDEDASYKQRINHTYDDITNDTFIITIKGNYSIHYSVSFQDTALSPDGHTVVRIILNGVEINGSLLEEDSTKQYSDYTISNGPIVGLDVGDKLKLQITSDDTTVALASHKTYGVHRDSATIKIVGITTIESSVSTTTYYYSYEKQFYANFFGIVLMMLGIGIILIETLEDIRRSSERKEKEVEEE